jgi:hypothetical protein
MEHGRSYEGFTVDALALQAEEGRGWLRKASGSRQQALIRGCPNGETRCGEPTSPFAEHIGKRGQVGELKHLSTRRKREYSLSSGERKGKSPNRYRGKANRRCGTGVERRDGGGCSRPTE